MNIKQILKNLGMLTLAFFIAYASSTLAYIYNPTGGGGGGSGTVTSITATSPLTGGTISTAGNIGCQTASGSQAGCLSSADWTTFNSKGNGTVTSVGIALPDIFNTSGSPVTTTGTLTGTLANQNANIVFAGPVSGGATTPTFRALVSADLPTIPLALSNITAATGTNIIDNGDFLQQWAWDTLSGNFGLELSSASTAVINGDGLIHIIMTGANASPNVATSVLNVENQKTGTNSSNVGATFQANNAELFNIGISGIASGGISSKGLQGSATGGQSSVGVSGAASGGTTNNLGGSFQASGTGSVATIGITGNADTANTAFGAQFTGTGAVTGIGAQFTGTGDNVEDSISAEFSGKAMLTSDAQSAFSVSGNSLTGISLTSGGNGNSESGMFENDGNTFIASYTPVDGDVTGDPMYFWGNRHLTYDVNTLQTTIGDARVTGNGTRIMIDDTSKTSSSFNAIASPTMPVDNMGDVLVTIPDGVRGMYYDPGSDPGTVAFTLPAAPIDGQEVILAFGGSLTSGTVVTSLSIVANSGQTYIGAPILTDSAKAGAIYIFKYRSDISAWYKIGVI